MKNIQIITLLILAFSFQGFAQGNYEKGMQDAFKLWGENKPSEAVALFERISNAEKNNWLPSYYAANVLIVSSFTGGTTTEKNDMLEKAKKHIAQAHEISPDNSEILTMEGLLYTGYVAMDPATYAMQYSEKIMGLHSSAVKIDPENPRAHANMIEYEMGGARFFNQELDPYCERMKKILVKFDNQKSDSPFLPSYGKERALEMINSCDK